MDRHSKFHLTKKEEEIMNVLWESEKPLSVADICGNAEKMGLSLNHNTVQMTVYKLLNNNLIRVGVFTQNYKAIARAFEPVMSADEFAVMKIQQIMNVAGKNKKSSYIASLLNDSDLTRKDLDELAALIEGLKNKQ